MWCNSQVDPDFQPVETLAKCWHASPLPRGKNCDDPNIAHARALSKKLNDGKRDEVLTTIKGLAEKDREALEVAVTHALDKPQADDLRRIIRFVRYKPPMGVTPESFTVERGQPRIQGRNCIRYRQKSGGSYRRLR